MKARLLLATVLLMCIFVLSTQASIGDVTIQPSAPTEADNISFDIVGAEASGDVNISEVIYNLDNNHVTLDLSMELGPFFAITPWSYTYDIGTLPAGIYDVTVNTIVVNNPSTNSTFDTSFEVVPEPTTLLLVSAGLCFLRKKKFTS